MPFIDDFVSLAGWTNGGGVSISPASWAYHLGNGTATGYIYRAQGTDSYVETKVYFDTNNNEWCMLKLDTSTANLFNQAAADGVAISQRSNGQGFIYGPTGTITYTGWSGSPVTGNGTWTITNPGSAAAAVILGLHRVATATYDFYVNHQYLGRCQWATTPTGTNISLGGYNSVGAHFAYCLADTRRWTPWDSRPETPSRVVT